MKLKAGRGRAGAVALVNRRLRGGLGFYFRYDARALPAYLAWRMMREGLYAIGLEPATNPFGNPDELIGAGLPARCSARARRGVYELEFGVLAGEDAIDAFAESLP